MQFAGNDYAYLSKKKITKINMMKNHELQSIPEEEKDLEMTNVVITNEDNTEKEKDLKMNLIHQNKEIQKGFEKTEEELDENKINEDDNLSNSCESFEEEQLNRSYSDEEDILDQKPIGKKVQNQSSKKYQQVVDTNIICIKFDFLKDKNPYATGEPNHCTQCNAYLSHLSALTEKDNKYIWDCEYCDKENILQIEKEEIPKEKIMDYFIGKEITQTKDKDSSKITGANQLIFCFDISGSMSHEYTCDVSITKGRITRLDCLKNAIIGNINALVKEAPETKVGLVSFGSNVIGYGDCLKKPVVLEANNLQDEKLINKLGIANQVLIEAPIHQSVKKLKDLLKSCSISGSTALGPAIQLSVSMIEKSTSGSRILLCTDGEANLGLGSLSDSNPQQFYTQVGNLAKEKGIVINLFTFEDAESRINLLMSMVEITGGEIIRVNPAEMADEFSNILSNDIVATNVSLQIKLHKTLCFKNEKAENLTDKESTLKKQIGNATKQTELYAEYGFKKAKIISKLPNFDINNLKRIYFQSVINYTNKEGSKCIRIITKDQKVEKERELVEKQANFHIVSTNALQKSALIARTGDFRKAQANAYAWKNYIKTNISSNAQAKGSYSLFSSNFKDFHHDLNQIHSNPQSQYITAQDKINQRMYQMQTSSVCNVERFTSKRKAQSKNQTVRIENDNIDYYNSGNFKSVISPVELVQKKETFGDKFKKFFKFK